MTSLLFFLAAALIPVTHESLHASPWDRTLGDMVTDSDRIVVGTVERLRTAFDEVLLTKDGKTGTVPYTYVTLRLSDDLKTNEVPSEIEFRVLGGSGEGFAVVAVHAAKVDPGEKMLVFLRESERSPASGSPVYYPPFGANGKFQIIQQDSVEFAVREGPDNSGLQVDLQYGVPDTGPIPLTSLRQAILSSIAQSHDPQ